jgi:GxxExxY protein
MLIMPYDSDYNDHHVPLYIKKIAAHVIERSYKIHSEFGPGLLEKSYEFCLFSELKDLGYNVKSQVLLPICYNDHTQEGAYRIDLIINDLLIVEINATESYHPVHKSQLLTYLRTGGYRLRLLINFHVVSLKDEIRRVVN